MTPDTPAVTAPTAATAHNMALDMMRAVTMVLMITVNHFWTAADVPHWMHHAAASEDMLGLSDTVFPLFLFVMGMSIPYAIDARYRRGHSERAIMMHIVERSVALLAMGAFICHSEYGIDAALSGYGHVAYTLLMVAAFFLVWHHPAGFSARWHKCCQAAGVIILTGLALTARNPEGGVMQAHWWGILGLIGWTYLVCSLVYFCFRGRTVLLTAIGIGFLALCVGLSPVGPVDEWHTLLNLPRPNLLDETLSLLHVGNCGLVSLGMGGVLLSVFTRHWTGHITLRRILVLLAACVALLLLGAASHSLFIVSKIHATPTWVLYVASIALALYALLSFLVQRGLTSWFRFIAPAGTATLTCYMIPYVLYALYSALHLTLPEWLAAWPMGALQCVVFAFLCVGLTYLLCRLGVRLKI